MSVDFGKIEDEYGLDYFDPEFAEFFDRGGMEVFIRFEDEQAISELIPDYDGLELEHGSRVDTEGRSGDVHRTEQDLSQTVSVELRGEKYLLDNLGSHSYSLKIPEAADLIELVDRYPVEAAEAKRPFPEK
jgi:hypothetical protein